MSDEQQDNLERRYPGLEDNWEFPNFYKDKLLMKDNNGIYRKISISWLHQNVLDVADNIEMVLSELPEIRDIGDCDEDFRKLRSSADKAWELRQAENFNRDTPLGEELFRENRQKAFNTFIFDEEFKEGIAAAKRIWFDYRRQYLHRINHFVELMWSEIKLRGLTFGQLENYSICKYFCENFFNMCLVFRFPFT